MDFYELNAFLHLSRTLHFAKAAQEVNLSPSALSRMISRLEEETGVILFDRDNREVTLTEKGKRFADFARRCIDDQTEILSEFSEKGDSVSGVLHVYASVTACYTIMPPFIKKLSAKYPSIQLSVETGDPAGAVNAVREGRAELAVAAIPDTGFEGIDCVSVRTSPLVFVASSTGTFSSINGSPQDIVSSVPLILPKAGLARRRFDAWIKSRNVKPIIAAETEGNEAVMALATLGLGIGLVPKIVLENGPYKSGFSIHSAGHAIVYYDIVFIQKMQLSGTEAQKRIHLAVTDILHNTKWDEFHTN